jgi:hypothetical protein
MERKWGWIDVKKKVPDYQHRVVVWIEEIQNIGGEFLPYGCMGLGIYRIPEGKWYLFDQSREVITDEEIHVTYWLDPDWFPGEFMKEEEAAVQHEKKRQRIFLEG